jgi:hypothetical protein
MIVGTGVVLVYSLRLKCKYFQSFFYMSCKCKCKCKITKRVSVKHLHLHLDIM